LRCVGFRGIPPVFLFVSPSGRPPRTPPVKGKVLPSAYSPSGSFWFPPPPFFFPRNFFSPPRRFFSPFPGFCVSLYLSASREGRSQGKRSPKRAHIPPPGPDVQPFLDHFFGSCLGPGRSLPFAENSLEEVPGLSTRFWSFPFGNPFLFSFAR